MPRSSTEPPLCAWADPAHGPIPGSTTSLARPDLVQSWDFAHELIQCISLILRDTASQAHLDPVQRLAFSADSSSAPTGLQHGLIADITRPCAAHARERADFPCTTIFRPQARAGKFASFRNDQVPPIAHLLAKLSQQFSHSGCSGYPARMIWSAITDPEDLTDHLGEQFIPADDTDATGQVHAEAARDRDAAAPKGSGLDVS
jgi:hypothetical protein